VTFEHYTMTFVDLLSL